MSPLPSPVIIVASKGLDLDPGIIALLRRINVLEQHDWCFHPKTETVRWNTWRSAVGGSYM